MAPVSDVTANLRHRARGEPDAEQRDSVPRHGHDLALRLQRLDELQLLLRPHAREHVHLAEVFDQCRARVVCTPS